MIESSSGIFIMTMFSDDGQQISFVSGIRRF
jgi:hypothetical protein